MNDPVLLPHATARFKLPVLFPGQSQKEFFVNEALARLDAVTHPVVEGVTPQAPQAPRIGECWIVGEGGAGEFASQTGRLAFYDGAQWSFIQPVDGMMVFDRAAALVRCFSGEWSRPAVVAPPTAGSTIDAEARQTIVAIMQALEALSLVRRG